MSISFDNALGIHDDAMLLRSKRAEILANNIANADTPGFEARDVDFKAILRAQGGGDRGDLKTTNTRHFDSGEFGQPDTGLLYRNPLQPALDQNTVDVEHEKAEFARNALQHQASYTFLNGKFKGLKHAITGQRS